MNGGNGQWKRLSSRMGHARNDDDDDDDDDNGQQLVTAYVTIIIDGICRVSLNFGLVEDAIYCY